MKKVKKKLNDKQIMIVMILTNEYLMLKGWSIRSVPFFHISRCTSRTIPVLFTTQTAVKRSKHHPTAFLFFIGGSSTTCSWRRAREPSAGSSRGDQPLGQRRLERRPTLRDARLQQDHVEHEQREGEARAVL